MLGAIVMFGIATSNVDIGDTAPWTWYFVMGMLFLFIMIAGHGISGRVSGFMVDA